MPLRSADIRLVVFDWDGTLLDSVGSIVACTQATLAELGLQPVADESIRTALGLGLRETVEAFCPGCDDLTFGRIVEVYHRKWEATYSRRPVLFPGVVEALADLAHGGLQLAVATAKSRDGLDRELRTTGLAERFAATRTNDESSSKPAPGMLLEILDELGVPAPEALMVGDSTHDLRMGINAGVATVAVCSGTHSRAALETLAPLACLPGVAELPGWLARRALATA